MQLLCSLTPAKLNASSVTKSWKAFIKLATDLTFNQHD